MKYLMTGLLIIFFYLNPTKGFAEEGGSSNQPAYIFSPSIHFRTDSRVRTDSSNVELLLYDLRLGYRTSDNWYFGWLYSQEGENTSTTQSGVTSYSSHSRTSQGPSIGYFSGKYYTILSLIFSGRWQLQQAPDNITYTGGTGVHLDFGMNFEVSPGWFIGPRFSYKKISYQTSKDATGEAELSPALQRASLDPYFVLWFEF